MQTALLERLVAPVSTFGEWLTAARKSRGLTLEILAERGDTTPATISRLSNGARDPSREMALKIADALALDGEDEEDRDRRRASALFAAGFVPDGMADDLARGERVAGDEDDLPPEVRRTTADLDSYIVRNVGGLDAEGLLDVARTIHRAKLHQQRLERLRQAGRDATIGGKRSDADENPTRAE